MSRHINLLFHGLGDPPEATKAEDLSYWVATDSYRRILELVDGREDVSISFDDGYRSDLEIGLPALVEAGRTAAFFPVMGWTGEPGYLDADDIRTLRDAGMHLGVHSMSHLDWATCSPAQLRQDLDDSRIALSQVLGQPVTSAACPFGSYDARVVAAVRDLGFTQLFTSDRSWATRGEWFQPRYSVRRHDTVDDVRRWLNSDTPPMRAANNVRMWVKRCRRVKRAALAAVPTSSLHGR